MLDNVKIKVSTTTQVSVPNTGSIVLSANTRRIYALIINNSDTDIYLNFGSQNAQGQGILVAANGYAFEIDKLNLWQGAIYAIHSGAVNKNLNVIECQ